MNNKHRSDSGAYDICHRELESWGAVVLPCDMECSPNPRQYISPCSPPTARPACVAGIFWLADNPSQLVGSFHRVPLERTREVKISGSPYPAPNHAINAQTRRQWEYRYVAEEAAPVFR